MILRRDGTDWLYINQLNHSRLAGRLMAAWQNDGFPARPTRQRCVQATSDTIAAGRFRTPCRASAPRASRTIRLAPLDIKQPPLVRG